jgi:dolichol-phosphate mannosyltransferase
MRRNPVGEDPLDGPDVSVVVPLYDEEENLRALYRRTIRALEPLGLDFELILVDDGSRDSTGRQIAELESDDPRVVAVHLSRNFGHQAAITAGIDRARGEAVVLMDGDLQDPPEVIPGLIEQWRRGAEVVYAVRRSRRESFPKRLAYAGFYRLLRAMSEIDIPLDSGDFCLMDRQVVDVLRRMPERVRFVRGLRSFVGFRQVPLEYDRDARAAGAPKYTFRALVRLAVDGLVGFSSAPLQVITYLGLLAATVALGLTLWVAWDAFTTQSAPRGWASTIIVVLFMGAIQMINQGIMGAYIRRLFLEVKGRPTYVERRPPARRERLDRPHTPARTHWSRAEADLGVEPASEP